MVRLPVGTSALFPPLLLSWGAVFAHRIPTVRLVYHDLVGVSLRICPVQVCTTPRYRFGNHIARAVLAT